MTMKKLSIALFALLFLAVTAYSQDFKDYYKDAKRAIGNYNMDQTNNADQLGEAVVNIDAAMDTEEGKMDSRAWALKGEIYNTIASQIVLNKQTGLGLSELPQVNDPAFEAYNAYQKALETAEKKYQTKDAIKGLQAVQSNLSNMGIYAYENSNFEEAFRNFNAALEVHEMLKQNGESSSLDAEEDLNNQKYITGLAALGTNNMDVAEEMFTDLYESGFAKPAVYEALYKVNAEDDMDAAYEYLEKGREQYPEDVSLLFAEINHYLKKGELNELITKLEEGIAAEPNNASLYSVMGNVYDQLYQKSLEAGDEEKAQEFFGKALDYYKQAQEVSIKNGQGKNFDATYSMGALYYNKAAALTQEMEKIADDYSKEGMKKYEAMREEVFNQFEKALPYFKEAEKINPNDVNTLVALKEIAAKTDDLELSNVFKERLDRVQAGETLKDSYYENNNE